MIDNEFYKYLDEKWFTAQGDAIALLRQENATKQPWVQAKIAENFATGPCRILDVGCGGGFLSLALRNEGHHCTALDVSGEVMRAGQRRDPEGKIDWVVGMAQNLPFADGSFDVVCAMDVLEHVEDPRLVIREAIRVLSPTGILLLHTFNRTWLAWLFAAKGLDWFIKDSPEHVHEWRLFIRPREVKAWLNEAGLTVQEFCGIHPVVFSRDFFNFLLTRRVPAGFRFALGGSLQIGYLCCARGSGH